VHQKKSGGRTDHWLELVQAPLVNKLTHEQGHHTLKRIGPFLLLQELGVVEKLN
jgi:hypothetical protein